MLTSALKIACDGATGMAKTANAKAVGLSGSKLACWSKDAVSWINTNVLDTAVDGVNGKVASGVGTAVNTVAGVLHSIWLVDPNTKEVMGKVSTKEAQGANMPLASSGLVYCFEETFEHCYKSNPMVTDTRNNIPVELK